MWESKYFSREEMKWKCGCDQAPMDQDFMLMILSTREHYGKPIIISSGYRCPAHPIEAKKAKPGSHTTGKAADLAVSGGDAMQIMGLALLSDIRRVGVQQKGEGRFIHLDICDEEDGFPTPALWSY